MAGVPDLNVVGVRGVDRGDSDYEVANLLDSRGQHLTIKYPLNDIAGAALEAEFVVADSLLEELREKNLPFDVLRPIGFSSYRDHRAAIFHTPAGRPLEFASFSAELARELGRTIAAIHSLEPAALTRVGMPEYTIEKWRARLTAELDEVESLGRVAPALIGLWRETIDDDGLWTFTPVVVHGDVADENFLWSEGTVRSVIGFGDAHIGDPATDFGPILASLSPEMFEQFETAYRNSVAVAPDEFLIQRAGFMSEFALARWLLHGELTHNDDVIADATQMLDDLAEQTITAPSFNYEGVSSEKLRFDTESSDSVQSAAPAQSPTSAQASAPAFIQENQD